MPGRDNVVADLLSLSITASAPAASPSSHDVEPEFTQMLHAPLQSAVSLEELQKESEHDPMLTTLHTYILSGWQARVLEELVPFARVWNELSCWSDVCVSRGLCTVVPSSLRARVLSMAHGAKRFFVKSYQRCCDIEAQTGILRSWSGTVNHVSSVERLDNQTQPNCSQSHGLHVHGSTYI